MENEKIKTKWKNSKTAITFGCVLKAHLLKKRGERPWKIKQNMKNYWNWREIKEYSKNTESNCLNVSCGIVMEHAEAVAQRCSAKYFHRDFAKFTGKQLWQSLFCKFIKKKLRHRCFLLNFVKLLTTPFLTEHLRWLLLNTENQTNKKQIMIHYTRV